VVLVSLTSHKFAWPPSWSGRLMVDYDVNTKFSKNLSGGSKAIRRVGADTIFCGVSYGLARTFMTVVMNFLFP
jgi:hypothetical protein